MHNPNQKIGPTFPPEPFALTRPCCACLTTTPPARQIGGKTTKPPCVSPACGAVQLHALPHTEQLAARSSPYPHKAAADCGAAACKTHSSTPACRAAHVLRLLLQGHPHAWRQTCLDYQPATQTLRKHLAQAYVMATQSAAIQIRTLPRRKTTEQAALPTPHRPPQRQAPKNTYMLHTQPLPTILPRTTTEPLATRNMCRTAALDLQALPTNPRAAASNPGLFMWHTKPVQIRATFPTPHRPPHSSSPKTTYMLHIQPHPTILPNTQHRQPCHTTSRPTKTCQPQMQAWTYNHHQQTLAQRIPAPKDCRDHLPGMVPSLAHNIVMLCYSSLPTNQCAQDMNPACLPTLESSQTARW